MFVLLPTPTQASDRRLVGVAKAALAQGRLACSGCSVSFCAVECVSTEEPRWSDGAIVCEPQG